MRIFFLMLLLCVGCAKKENVQIEYPERLPLTEQSKELTMLPEYQAPTEEGQTAPVNEGDPAPFDGVLLDETKGFAAANLRIAYDELHSTALANNKFFLTVIEIQGRELHRADEVILRKDQEIDKLRNSWWQRNKVWVGVSLGLIGGIVVCLATERLVLEVQEAANTP